jgi:hypothetical protein
MFCRVHKQRAAVLCVVGCGVFGILCMLLPCAVNTACLQAMRVCSVRLACCVLIVAVLCCHHWADEPGLSSLGCTDCCAVNIGLSYPVCE